MRHVKTFNVLGDRRTRSWFAWFPAVVNTRETHETRWLERVTVEQEYIIVEKGANKYEDWKNVRFADAVLDTLRDL